MLVGIPNAKAGRTKGLVLHHLGPWLTKGVLKTTRCMRLSLFLTETTAKEYPEADNK